MAQALVSIRNVTLSRNPVATGETFIISVEIFSFPKEKSQRRLPVKLGRRKEIR